MDLADTLRREIAEELHLSALPGPDQVSLSPVGGEWVETALSATYGILTRYTFRFFQATHIHFRIMLDTDTQWLSRAEIAAGRADDGREVSSIYLQALGLDAIDSLPPALDT